METINVSRGQNKKKLGLHRVVFRVKKYLTETNNENGSDNITLSSNIIHFPPLLQTAFIFYCYI